MIDKEKFILLLEKYTSEDITLEERTEFLAAVASGMYDELLLQHIEKKLSDPPTNMEIANLPPHRSADILHKILSSEKQNSLLLPKQSSKLKVRRWTIAAALIVAITISTYLFIDIGKKQPVPNASFANMLAKTNSSSQPLKMEMEEGSIITLYPGSTIHYPVHFLTDKRELFLEGEAFFEVSKNASRPFFVYNENIVTHVLGTSFNVRMNKKTKQVEVSVRSGKVEVYENKIAVKNSTTKINNGVILLPNQKVIYDQDTRQFVPSLVDVPLPIIQEMSDTKTAPETAVFEATPLKTVLGTLEKMYGIEIIAETEKIYKCQFTGDVNQQDLYTKLDIICQSVQASYEVKGIKILIKGKGCN